MFNRVLDKPLKIELFMTGLWGISYVPLQQLLTLLKKSADVNKIMC